MTIIGTPTTPEGWRQRAIQHYQKSRAMMARYKEYSAPTPVGDVTPIGQAAEADRAYKIAANETQAAIAAGIIADAGFNEMLTPGEPVSGPPLDWEKGIDP